MKEVLHRANSMQEEVRIIVPAVKESPPAPERRKNATKSAQKRANNASQPPPNHNPINDIGGFSSKKHPTPPFSDKDGDGSRASSSRPNRSHRDQNRRNQ
jgi:hypothetical protein